MLIRALVVWFGLLVLAIANGALREFAMVPSTGDTAGHAISSVTLSVAIVMLCWFTIAWIGPTATRDAWMIGLMWVGLTLAFEFLAGHYIFGTPWSQLWADYNVLRGRIWVLVLLTTLLSPVFASGHGFLGRTLQE
jgi:hypothetical protein